MVTFVRLLALAFIGAILLWACGGEPDTQSVGYRVFDVTVEQWDATPTIKPLKSNWIGCENLDRFRVLVPKKIQDYYAICPANSNACLRSDLLPGKVRSFAYPVAVINPDLREARHVAAALHELLHAFMECSYGAFDYTHSNKLAWENAGPQSVETRSEVILYGFPGMTTQAVWHACTEDPNAGALLEVD